MMMLPPLPTILLSCLPPSLTHTHMLLMGFHYKWLFIPEPAGRKSTLPDLLPFVYSGTLRPNHTADHLRPPIY